MKSEEKIFAGFGLDMFPVLPHFYWLGPVEKLVYVNDKPLADGEPIWRTREIEKELGKYVPYVSLEELVDAPVIGISIDDYGEIKVQNGNQFLKKGNKTERRFGPLWDWVSAHAPYFQEVLWPNLILFGSWAYFAERVVYNKLPDYFIATDVYDRDEAVFLNSWAKFRIFRECGVFGGPELMKSQTAATLDDVLNEVKYINESEFGSSHVYGWRIRFEGIDIDYMGKLLHSEFAGVPWIKRQIPVVNSLKAVQHV